MSSNLQSSSTFDVIIAGAGPAGSSAAIHLAASGANVLLIEQKQFPRAKLCGEFISPECVAHFERLGVAGEMVASQPALLSETVFYSRAGKHITVPSGWFGSGNALGLSRAVMDNNLMKRARALGVSVLENTQVGDLVAERGRIRGVKVKRNGVESEHHGKIIVDATGRARVLTRRVDGDSRQPLKRKQRPGLVAFKVHMRETRVAPGVCEIYSYPGGYGGLSTVEDGLSNLCFIVSSQDVRRCHSNTEQVLREIVLKNGRAAYTLETAKVSSEWLSVSLESFGRRETNPYDGLLAVGDSATFIDPFTGSGMLMALESGELAAAVIVRHLNKLSEPHGYHLLADEYNLEYGRKFDSRLRMCGLLRRAAFKPRLAEFTIAVCGASDRLRSRIARATRRPSRESGTLAESVK